MPKLRHPVIHRKAKKPERQPTVEDVRRTTAEEIGKAAREVRRAMAEPEPVKPGKKQGALDGFSFPNVPWHYLQGKGAKKGIKPLYKAHKSGLMEEMQKLENARKGIENKVQGLQKGIEETRFALGKFLIDPRKWVHPIKYFKESKTGKRKELIKARAELKRFNKVHKAWAELYKTELALLDTYYNRLEKNPCNENAIALADLIMEIYEKNKELRFTANVAVEGRGYVARLRRTSKPQGRYKGSGMHKAYWNLRPVKTAVDSLQAAAAELSQKY